MNQMVQNVQQGAHVQAALRENFAASCSRPAREIERVRVRGRDERERDDGKKRRKGGKVAGKAECNAACSKKCSNCGTSTTPFWRKNKHGGLPLCNACGLYFSKNDAPRPRELWRGSSDTSAINAPAAATTAPPPAPSPAATPSAAPAAPAPAPVAPAAPAQIAPAPETT